MTLLCMSCIERYSRAEFLGRAFSNVFRAEAAKLLPSKRKDEIALFRAMHEALVSIGNQVSVQVEEYHGARHQVGFSGPGGYARVKARCELSDLAVIVYDRDRQEARLTYIQTKSERKVSACTNGIAGRALAANLEQWHLLARRPRISGHGTFKPPTNLLSDANLWSIGTFAFFVHGQNGVDIYYAAAPMLQMVKNYKRPHGKLIAARDVVHGHCHDMPECLSVYGSASFGVYLFGLMIGEPVLLNGNCTNYQVGKWLAAQLRAFAASASKQRKSAELASELAGHLDPEGEATLGTDATPEGEPHIGAANVLLVGIGPSPLDRSS